MVLVFAGAHFDVERYVRKNKRNKQFSFPCLILSAEQVKPDCYSMPKSNFLNLMETIRFCGTKKINLDYLLLIVLLME